MHSSKECGLKSVLLRVTRPRGPGYLIEGVRESNLWVARPESSKGVERTIRKTTPFPKRQGVPPGIPERPHLIYLSFVMST